MQKVPTLFMRDESDRKHVTREVNPECQWVLAGEGVPTRKYDDTGCLVRDGKRYKRYEIKAGKAQPPGFEPADEVDPNTGNQPGWVPVGDGPEDRYHREASTRLAAELEDGSMSWSGGTCELVGPKVQGNPEHYGEHRLIPHDLAEKLLDAPRDFDGLREWLLSHDFEGIVWHWPQKDGSVRMAKLKKRDFA